MAENLINLSTLFSGDNLALNTEGAGLNYLLNVGSDIADSAFYSYATAQNNLAKGQFISNLIPYDYSALSQTTNGLYLTVTGYSNPFYCFMRYMFEDVTSKALGGQNTFFAFYSEDKTLLGLTALTNDGLTPSCNYTNSTDGTIFAVDPTSASYSGSTPESLIPQDWSQVKYVRFNCYPNSSNSSLADDSLITTSSISNFQVFRGNTLAKTTADRLQKIIDTKAALKTALNRKGCTITDSTPFAEYATQAANIETGITPTGIIDITTNGTVDVTNYASANVNVVSDYNVKMLDTNLESNGSYNISTFITQLPDTISVVAGDRNHLFEGMKRIYKLPSITNDSQITSANYFASSCENLGIIPDYNMSQCTSFDCAFLGIYTATGLTIGSIDMSSATSINKMFQSTSPEVKTELAGFPNLGKAYLTTAIANYANYRLDLRYLETLTEQSAINVLNNLYDIKTKGCNVQQVYFINLATDNFTSAEYTQAVANATAKGWTVRIIED